MLDQVHFSGRSILLLTMSFNQLSECPSYITHHNTAREGPRHGHRQHASKICWSLDVWLLRYSCGCTDRPIHDNTLLAMREVLNMTGTTYTLTSQILQCRFSMTCRWMVLSNDAWWWSPRASFSNTALSAGLTEHARICTTLWMIRINDMIYHSVKVHSCQQQPILLTTSMCIASFITAKC